AACRPSGYSGSLPSARGLARRAPADRTRVGRRCGIAAVALGLAQVRTDRGLWQCSPARGIDSPETRKARHGRSRAGVRSRLALLHPVGAVAVLGLEGFDNMACLLHRTRHEPADRVLLPAHGFHDLRQGGAVLPLEHRDHLRRLATLAWPGSFRLRPFPGLGRVLRLGWLRLCGRALGRLCGTLSLLCGFALWLRFRLGRISEPLDAVPDAAGACLGILESL